jgi:hypothetical protein
MIPINLLYWRFDNLLRTISEIVTRGIVFGNPRAREAGQKSGIRSTEINNDKLAGSARSTSRSSYLVAGNSVFKKISLTRCAIPGRQPSAVSSRVDA